MVIIHVVVVFRSVDDSSGINANNGNDLDCVDSQNKVVCCEGTDNIVDTIIIIIIIIIIVNDIIIIIIIFTIIIITTTTTTTISYTFNQTR